MTNEIFSRVAQEIAHCDGDLANKLTILIGEILQRANGDFAGINAAAPAFASHGPDHWDRLALFYESTILPQLAGRLNYPGERFAQSLLLCSFICHDVGMGSVPRHSDLSTHLRDAHARGQHDETSVRWLLKNLPLLASWRTFCEHFTPIFDGHLAHYDRTPIWLLARLCQSHCDAPGLWLQADSLQKFNPPDLGRDQVPIDFSNLLGVNWKSLSIPFFGACAILSLCDLCEVSPKRMPWFVTNNLRSAAIPTDPRSKTETFAHLFGHNCVTGIALSEGLLQVRIFQPETRAQTALLTLLRLKGPLFDLLKWSQDGHIFRKLHEWTGVLIEGIKFVSGGDGAPFFEQVEKQILCWLYNNDDRPIAEFNRALLQLSMGAKAIVELTRQEHWLVRDYMLNDCPWDSPHIDIAKADVQVDKLSTSGMIAIAATECSRFSGEATHLLSSIIGSTLFRLAIESCPPTACESYPNAFRLAAKGHSLHAKLIALPQLNSQARLVAMGELNGLWAVVLCEDHDDADYLALMRCLRLWYRSSRIGPRLIFACPPNLLHLVGKEGLNDQVNLWKAETVPSEVAQALLDTAIAKRIAEYPINELLSEVANKRCHPTLLAAICYDLADIERTGRFEQANRLFAICCARLSVQQTPQDWGKQLSYLLFAAFRQSRSNGETDRYLTGLFVQVVRLFLDDKCNVPIRMDSIGFRFARLDQIEFVSLISHNLECGIPAHRFVSSLLAQTTDFGDHWDWPTGAEHALDLFTQFSRLAHNSLHSPDDYVLWQSVFQLSKAILTHRFHNDLTLQRLSDIVRECIDRRSVICAIGLFEAVVRHKTIIASTGKPLPGVSVGDLERFERELFESFATPAFPLAVRIVFFDVACKYRSSSLETINGRLPEVWHELSETFRMPNASLQLPESRWAFGEFMSWRSMRLCFEYALSFVRDTAAAREALAYSRHW